MLCLHSTHTQGCTLRLKSLHFLAAAVICFYGTLPHPAFAAHSHREDAVKNECYVAAKRSPSRLSHSDASTLCNRTQSLAPLRCIKNFPSSASGSLRSHLCSPTGSLPDIPAADPLILAPAKCASILLAKAGSSRTKKSLPAEEAAVDLCMETNSPSPGECAVAALARMDKGGGGDGELGLGFSLSAAVALCYHAPTWASLAPVKCARVYLWGPDDNATDEEEGRSSDRPLVGRGMRKRSGVGGGDLAASLCAEASSDAPALCALEVARALKQTGGSSSVRLQESDQVQLCRRATASLGPPTCVAALSRSLVTPAQAVRVCKEALSDAPAACLHHIRRSIQGEEAVDLCSGAVDLGPALCAMDTPPTFAFRVALCRNFRSGSGLSGSGLPFPPSSSSLSSSAPPAPAPPSGPSTCVKRFTSSLSSDHLSSHWLSSQWGKSSSSSPSSSHAPTSTTLEAYIDHLALSLCRAAPNQAPADCFHASPDYLEPALRVRLCSQSSTTAPAACASRALHRLHTKDDDDQPRNAVDLCRGANGLEPHAPVDCASRALALSIHESDVAVLCRGVTKDTSSGPIACVAAAPFSMTSPQKVKLCALADSTTPADCAVVAHEKLRTPLRLYSASLGSDTLGDVVVDLCSGAVSRTPAFCAAHHIRDLVYQKRGMEAMAQLSDVIKRCRVAKPEPTSLVMHRWWMEAEGGAEDDTPEHRRAIIAKRNLHVLLTVLDQFQQPCAYSSPTAEVRVSTGSPMNGGVLEGITRNVSVGDRAEFHFLRFAHGGAFDIRFTIADSPPAVTMRVEVAPAVDEGMGPSGECGKMLYPFLSSFPSAEPNASFDFDNTIRAAGEEQVSVLAWPFSVYSLLCMKRMEELGFSIFPGWRGDLWVRYRPAMEALETGEGMIPAEHMGDLERLSLSSSSDHRHPSHELIRQRYHRLSLLWHPDRWAQYPEFQPLAQKAFELISESYKSLSVD